MTATDVPAIIRWDQAYNRNGDSTLPRAVMNAIRTHMDNYAMTGWVKQETLAEYTGLSVRQVQRHITANVAAGWLEITNPGNSGGKANDYRLTFPKDDTDVAPTRKATQMSPEGRRGRQVKDDTNVVPTTPRTTPGSSPKRRTTPEKGDIGVALPDPFAGSGDVIFPASSTTEWEHDMDVALPELTQAEMEEIQDEVYGAEAFTPAPMTPVSDEEAAERRLRAAMADGPIPAWTARDVAGMSQPLTNAIVTRLINAGVFIHDQEARRLSLA